MDRFLVPVIGCALGSVLAMLACVDTAVGHASSQPVGAVQAPRESDRSLQADMARSAPYVAAIGRYRDGHTDESLNEVLGWEDADVKVAAWLHVLSAAFMTPPQPDRVDVLDVEAAILLHTQASLEADNALRPAATQRHLSAALTLLAWLDRLDWVRTRSHLPPVVRAVPIRDWFLATMVGFNRLASMETVASVADDAARRFPTDAEIQLAAGAIDELRVTVGPGRYQPVLVTTAIARFRAALAAQGDCHEAAVRLGRMLSRQGVGHEAERVLMQVLRDGQDARVRYLAQLFLGGELERQRRRDEAIGEYRAAIATRPQAQAARTALAHLLRQAGQTDEARAVIEPGLEPAAPRDITSDPYWAYGLGPMLNPADLFERMLKGVRR